MSKCDQVGADEVPSANGPGDGAGLDTMSDDDGFESSSSAFPLE